VGEGCYHGDSIMGLRGVTMHVKVQWRRGVLPWVSHNIGCLYVADFV
jgi:hypothetical protein